MTLLHNYILLRLKIREITANLYNLGNKHTIDWAQGYCYLGRENFEIKFPLFVKHLSYKLGFTDRNVYFSKKGQYLRLYKDKLVGHLKLVKNFMGMLIFP